MSIDDRRFIALVDEVESQGGALLPGVCKPRTIRYRPGQEHVKNAQEPLNTTGCNRERRFEIPDRMTTLDTGDRGTTVACADDDRVDLWPRFASVMFDDGEL